MQQAIIVWVSNSSPKSRDSDPHLPWSGVNRKSLASKCFAFSCNKKNKTKQRQTVHVRVSYKCYNLKCNKWLQSRRCQIFLVSKYLGTRHKYFLKTKLFRQYKDLLIMIHYMYIQQQTAALHYFYPSITKCTKVRRNKLQIGNV